MLWTWCFHSKEESRIDFVAFHGDQRSSVHIMLGPVGVWFVKIFTSRLDRERLSGALNGSTKFKDWAHDFFEYESLRLRTIELPFLDNLCYVLPAVRHKVICMQVCMRQLKKGIMKIRDLHLAFTDFQWGKFLKNMSFGNLMESIRISEVAKNASKRNNAWKDLAIQQNRSFLTSNGPCTSLLMLERARKAMH